MKGFYSFSKFFLTAMLAIPAVSVSAEDDVKFVCDYNGRVFNCREHVPPIALNLDEFIEGKGTVEGREYLDEESFGWYETDDREEMGDCFYTITREYKVDGINGEGYGCRHTIVVENVIPPVFENESVNDSIEIFIYDGSRPVFPNVSASGLCSEDKYFLSGDAENIEQSLIDEYGGIYFTEQSTFDDDYRFCDYWNYDVYRMYVAIDRCGNKSKPLYVNVHVKDTIAPYKEDVERLITNWEYADMAKPCKNLVPDFVENDLTELFGDRYGKLFSIYQEPAAHSVIDSSQIVKIIARDACGNETVVEKFLNVQDRKSIIKLAMNDTSICSASEMKITSPGIFSASGEMKMNIYDTVYDVKLAIMLDIYKGDLVRHDILHPDSLVYSTNPYTMMEKDMAELGLDIRNFSDVMAYREQGIKRITLDDKKKGDYYTIVAMDTTSFCSDTVSSYIGIDEIIPDVYCGSDSVIKIFSPEYIDTAGFYDFLDTMELHRGTLSPLVVGGCAVGSEYYITGEDGEEIRFEKNVTVPKGVYKLRIVEILPDGSEVECTSTLIFSDKDAAVPTITNAEREDGELSIYSMDGNLVMRTMDRKSLSGLPFGVYLIKSGNNIEKYVRGK